MKILLIDDDRMVLEALAETFKAEWPESQPTLAASASEAMGKFSLGEPDLVVLDVGLGGENGFELLERIRRVSDVPIMLITGRGIEIDEIRGLQLGADDFVRKPFTQSLVVARVKSLLRRTDRAARSRGVPDCIAGDLAIDFSTHEVTLRGELVKLTPVEYRLLYHLARSSGRLVSHRELLHSVWGDSAKADLGRLHVYVKRLRDKIEKGTTLVENERGVGYRFVRPSPVRRTSN